MNITVRASRYSDIKDLCSDLRSKDRLESLKLGFEPDIALKYSYKNALWRKTGLINDKVAAMWGVVGSGLSDTGYPYLMTGILVEQIAPITFVKIYKQELSEMKQLFPILENYVDSSYTESVRLLKMTGFELESVSARGLQKFKMINNNG